MVTTRSATARNQTKFSDLPSTVVASILSYAIADTRDFAQLRLLSRSIKNDVLPMVFTDAKTKGHFIKGFYKKSDFLTQILKMNNEDFDGRIIHFPSSEKIQPIFEGATIECILLLKEGEQSQASMRDTDFDHGELSSKISRVQSIDEMYELNRLGLEKGSFLPSSDGASGSRTRNGRKGSTRRSGRGTKRKNNEDKPIHPIKVFTAQVILKVPCDAPCIESQDGVLLLKARAQPKKIAKQQFFKLGGAYIRLGNDDELCYFLPQEEDEEKMFQGNIVECWDKFSESISMSSSPSSSVASEDEHDLQDNLPDNLPGDSNSPRPSRPSVAENGHDDSDESLGDPSEFGYIAEVLMNVRISRGSSWDLAAFPSDAVYLSSLWEKHQKQMSVEGVSIVDGLMPMSSRSLLMANIDKLASSQDPVDYHPHSNNVVRDIVHPALYSFIKGESTVLPMDKVPPCNFSNLLDVPDNVSRPMNHTEDYWGRHYEASAKYQWLPTYFDIAPDGQCSICDYINNLVPREKHTDLYASLEGLFSLALPSIESVYSYARSIQPKICHSDSDVEPSSESELKYCSLRGQRLQVITKIVDYELGPGEDYEGVWHVEGMSHEEIVATALYVLHRDDDIVGGDILFKRAFFSDEIESIQSREEQGPPPLDDMIEDGLMPLGKAQTLPGRLIVFPNSHVHKVKTIEHILEEPDIESDEDKKISEDDEKTDKNKVDEDNKTLEDKRENVKKQKRRIVVFFLVNPEHRIISTREVPPQQETMSLEKAFEHRLKLMKERKYHKQDWNVRDIELCEH